MSGNLPRVIQYIGDNKTLVYKFSCEDLNNKSKLIVNESQEALFYKSGQALDLFGAGEHELKTENLPFIKRVFSKLFGGATPFPCDVFFINKVDVLDIMWGTDTPMDVKDPEYPIIVGVRAFGQTGIRIKDSRRFVVRVVGQMSDYSVESVRRAIKGMMISSIKESIAKAIIEKGVSILKLSAMLSELSQNISTHLNERIADLGLELNHFSIASINTTQEDAEELRALMDVDKEKRKMDILGYTYHDERKYDIMEGAATNQGMAGGFMGMGMGLGMGSQIGNGFGQMFNNMVMNGGQQAPQNQMQQEQQALKKCDACGAQIPMNSKFCLTCGAQQQIQQHIFCPECGNKCAPGSKFCMNCGNKLG